LTIEGIKEFESLRDFLYARMRGVKDTHAHSSPPNNTQPVTSSTASESAASADELTLALREAVSELRAIRSALEKRDANNPEEPRHV
jgi:putative membrane protein